MSANRRNTTLSLHPRAVTSGMVQAEHMGLSFSAYVSMLIRRDADQLALHIEQEAAKEGKGKPANHTHTQKAG